MPKLDKKMAKAVSSAEISTGDFPLLDPGYYYAQLNEVEVLDGNYAPRWNVSFYNLHKKETGEAATGRQWYNINVPADGPAPANYTNGDKKWAAFQSMSLGQLHGFFDAFGYSTDSDTDEMIGEWVVLKVAIEVIKQGDRKGDKTNRVKALTAVPDDFDPTEFDEESDGAF
jgi:hypothetical protein